MANTSRNTPELSEHDSSSSPPELTSASSASDRSIPTPRNSLGEGDASASIQTTQGMPNSGDGRPRCGGNLNTDGPRYPDTGDLVTSSSPFTAGAGQVESNGDDVITPTRDIRMSPDGDSRRSSPSSPTPARYVPGRSIADLRAEQIREEGEDQEMADIGTAATQEETGSDAQ